MTNPPDNSSIEVRILVVDDNPKNIVAMKSILSSLPITLHTAMSGEEALKATLRNTYAVIFLDVQMPEMDGYEVAKFLTQNKKTANIPIIFITAILNDNENIKEGYNSGAVDYLTKPVDPNILIAKTKIFIKLFEQQEKLSRLVKKLNDLAHIDSLTKLSNRQQFNVFFEKLLATSIRYNRKFALLLLDLDNFKAINDSKGHDIGDELLKEIAIKLTNEVRGSDLVARIGGDEFVILSSDLNSPNDASSIAKNIIKLVSEPIKLNNQTISTSVSIGIATFPFAGETVETLFKAADIALYRAKDKGRNTFEYFSETLNETCKRRLLIENELQRAIDKNEVFLHYQPRIEITSGKIISVEALARWNHPTLSALPPLEFIQIAEETGCIYKLGAYLIEKAFQQFQQWQKQWVNNNFTISINLSPFQLLNSDFVEELNNLITQYKIDVSRLEFELTESIFNGHEEELENILNKACELGVKFSIDDFGTGYSSLSRLKSLPISLLKIDQSFVRDIATDPNDAAIIIAIIALSKALKIDVIAEGVETEEQANFLLEHGCNNAQGFLYYKPKTSEEMDVILANE